MKKSIGIYLGPYYYHWDESTVASGMGGSETWAIEVGKELAILGYEVTIYADPIAPKYIASDCQLVPYTQYFLDLQRGRYYDYFIYSRVMDQVSPWLKCHNVYAMAHDTQLVDYKTGTHNLARIKKVGYLSDWHATNLLDYHKSEGLTRDRLFKTINGASVEYYNHTGIVKENSTVWSSSLVRGFFLTYYNVYYPIIKEIPDFKVYVCVGDISESDRGLLDKARLLPNVEVLGRLSKKELANYQLRSKIWIYPGVFQETFCITAVENAYAGNALICPPTYGLGSTLKGYVLWSEMNPIRMLVDTDEGASAQLYVEKALECLYNDSLARMYADSAYQICSKYNWRNAALSWDSEFRKCDEIPISQLS